MNHTFRLILVIFLAGECIHFSVAGSLFSQSSYFPPIEGEWQTLSPQYAGWEQEGLERVISYCENQTSSGLLIIQNGKILAEKFWNIEEERKKNAFGALSVKTETGFIEDVASIQKSVVSLLIAQAIQKGLLKRSSSVSTYLGNAWSNSTKEEERSITIDHLLSMTSGLANDLTYLVPAGSKWAYNTKAYSILIDVLEKVGKQPIRELTKDWLTDAIGIQDSYWARRPEGFDNPNGYLATARDLARLALLIQHQGKWGKEDIIGNPDFIAKALRPSQQMNPSYGLLYWLNTNRQRIPAAPADMISMNGLLNRYVFLVPSLDLVVVRLGNRTEKGFDKQLWEYLMQAMPKPQINPKDIRFVRQGVKRLIFDPNQAIPLAELDPANVIGLSAMHPTHLYSESSPSIKTSGRHLIFESEENQRIESSTWFGGFNPFATYTLESGGFFGEGSVGFEFADQNKQNRLIVAIDYVENKLMDLRLKIIQEGELLVDKSIMTVDSNYHNLAGRTMILQCYGSGMTVLAQTGGLPVVLGQTDIAPHMDIREKHYLQTFQSNLYVVLKKGRVGIRKVESILSTGLGQADIRAITLQDGSPLIDQGRLWYTMSIRGRALPHHIQGVFSMSPSVFDVRLEGIIVFDRGDGLLRNEISSHIFYDDERKMWKGLTTGFSAFAFPDKEEKQILAVESKRDPRFGFSVMRARPMGIVGDIEDSHIRYDREAKKWRLLTCENLDGYKAVMMESDQWDANYQRIAGPVSHNSTGTSMHQIGRQWFCFSGSSERNIFIYTYPDLKEVGTLSMDLPPWNESSRTRVWPNVLALPEGYPAPYIALMMDRFNFPGLKGPNWTYGALYLYYGYD
ncbi:MAG: serine hydrolase [Bacteroidota bacterium]